VLRAGEADRLDGRTGDEAAARLDAEDNAEDTVGRAGVIERRARDAVCPGRCPRVRLVCLDDDRAAGRGADAVSPPRTEKANGKLLAENTTHGPIGRSIRRMSGRASDAFAVVITAST